jgi:putative thioredoxin
MAPKDIIDVTESSFEYEVINYSQNTPVVVDFWAPWCRPCKTLSPILEALSIESDGGFRLARLNVDPNPNVALRYAVRSLPTVKAFSQGEVVSEFVGLLPEARIREFLSKITPPSPLSLAIERAAGLLSLRQWANAEQMYRKILQQSPNNPECMLGLARSLLFQNKGLEAHSLLRNFPASRQYSQAERLLPLAEALVEHEAGLETGQSDLDAAFNRARALIQRGNLAAALDGLLDILRQDRRYDGGRARLVVLGILELMGEDDPLTRQYRSELASILF